MTDDAAANRVAELRASVDDAAKSVSALYITFVLAGIYISLAIGSTTDLQLLVESDINLPLLNVGLPVRAFYILVPFGFMLFHLYILLHIYFLSVKLAAFEQQLLTLRTPREQEYQRGLLFPFTISPVSINASGAPAVIKGVLWLIVATTVLVAPPAMLAFALLRFVPYHSLAITWWHRVLLFSDITMLFALWIFILRCSPARPDGFWRRLGTGVRRSGVAIAPIVIVAALFGTVVTVPGEGLERRTSFLDPAREHLHRNLVIRSTTVVKESPPAELVAAYIQQGRTKDDAWREHAKGIDLQGRDLRGADFSHSNFYSANLKGANLDLASLKEANFQGSDFSPLGQDDGPDVATSLRGANLSGVDLRHSTLEGADLRGAEVREARMDGVYFLSANLAGVRQTNIMEQVTGIFGLHLQGATLFGAYLQGADLRWADLRGADLNVAHLQGAILRGANLTGAALTRTDLRGADLHATLLDLCEFQQVLTGPLSADELKSIRESNDRLPRRSAPGPATKREYVVGFDEPLKLPASTYYDSAFAKFAHQPEGTLPKEDDYIKHAVAYLSGLACKDLALARGMAYRSLMHLVFETMDHSPKIEEHHISSLLATELLHDASGESCPGAKYLSPTERDDLESMSHGRRPISKPGDTKR